MPFSASSSYDALPYEDLAYYHTHPSNLAVVANLCGLNPPAVTTCRVLELGCGAGFNLLAMAHSLPNAQFVGVDFSARQIEQGCAVARKLGIDRLALYSCDVAQFDPSFGQFDYIIGHGIFSWVPEVVRRAILALCQRHLAPHGIAYLSYNTYPGWHLRSILRDALLFHAPKDLPLIDQVRQAKQAVEQMLQALPDADSYYARILREEVEGIRNDSEIYLAHEFLEQNNHPLHFEEFARHAAEHSLQYLAEARFETSSFVQRPDLQRLFDSVSNELVRREQYHDFLRNRYFRQSLLCHSKLQPPRNPARPGFDQLRVHSRVELLGCSTEDGGLEVERFRLHGESVLATPDPLMRTMVHCLHESWPQMLTVARLNTLVRARLSSRTELQINNAILRGYLEGLWLLFAYDPPYVSVISDMPVACPLAIHQAKQRHEVINRLHRSVKLTDEERKLLLLLDGSRTRQQLTGGEELREKQLQQLVEASLVVK